MIKVDSISKSFDNRTLFSSLSFSIDSGITLLEGKSGCGKSTLMYLLMGIEKSDSGSITYKDHFTYSFAGQIPSLFANLSLEENIRKLKPDLDEMRFHELEKLLSYHSKDKKLYSLSGGERQKCELLFALSKKADCYFLDEPFSSLDKKSKENLAIYLREFSKEHPIIIINHDDSIKLDNIIQTLSFADGNVHVDKTSVSKCHETQIQRKNRPWLAFSDYFRSQPFFSFARVVLSGLAFLFFVLGLSFTNRNSRVEQALISLPYNGYKVQTIQGSPRSGVLDSNNGLVNFGDSNGYPYFTNLSARVSTATYVDYIGINIFFCLDSQTNYFFNNSSIESVDTITLTFDDSSSLTLEELTDEELLNLSIADSRPITTLVESETDTTLSLFLDKSCFNRCVTGDITSIRINDLFTIGFQYSLSYSRDDNCLVFNNDYESNNVEIVEDTSYLLSVPGLEKNAKVWLDSNKTSYLITTEDASEKIRISTSTLKTLLFYNNKINYLFNNSDFEKAYSYSGTYCPDLIADYTRANNYYLIFYSLSIVFFICALFFSCFTVAGKRKYLFSIRSIYETEQIKGYQLGFFLASLIEQLPLLILSFILYPTAFLPLANMIMFNKEGFSASLSGATSPIPFLHFDNLIFILFIYFVVFVLVNSLTLILGTRKNKL